MIEYETMTYERKGRIAYIMFNRPQVLNAGEPPIRGGPARGSAGIRHGRRGVGGHHPRRGTGLLRRGRHQTAVRGNARPGKAPSANEGPSPEGYLGRTINWKPVIAAVHGYALGTGIVIASECDMIVASEDARFGIIGDQDGAWRAAGSGPR